MVEHFTMYFRPTLNQSLSLYMYIRGDYLMRIIMIYELIPWSMHACHSEQNNIKLVHYWLISLNLLTLSYKCTLCYIAASKYRSYDCLLFEWYVLRWTDQCKNRVIDLIIIIWILYWTGQCSVWWPTCPLYT